MIHDSVPYRVPTPIKGVPTTSWSAESPACPTHLLKLAHKFAKLFTALEGHRFLRLKEAGVSNTGGISLPRVASGQGDYTMRATRSP